MKDNIFKKEYFDFYEFMVEAEKSLRNEPSLYKVTSGFLYLGGEQPIYNVVSAVRTEKEAYSLLNKKTTIETLSELLDDIEVSKYREDKWLIPVIRRKIKELEDDDSRGDFQMTDKTCYNCDYTIICEYGCICLLKKGLLKNMVNNVCDDWN